MAKKSSTRSDYTQLNVFAAGLKQLDDGKYKVQVGIFGDKAARRNEEAGMTNAEIGFINEMGSVSRHIPRRSFLLDTFSYHGAELMTTLKPQVDALLKNGKVDEYLKQVGIACTNLVIEAFDTSGWGAWPQNAYSTIMGKLKGSLLRRKQMAAEVLYEGASHTKPLIRTGQLWQSISSRTVKS